MSVLRGFILEGDALPSAGSPAAPAPESYGVFLHSLSHYNNTPTTWVFFFFFFSFIGEKTGRYVK